ncbi:methyl-accepting chemotaxis protein [Pseudomaricurvus alkylphenolicus]|uniref:methyl-accepting chemotaxis protein n=1 Tax=Pseudomaricurvus alkylphenolicus TaxID=1306991 RepID=UPI0014244C46|nr:PAS domain-containing methyl-accepting chemotaxis protein [Pseudomaricurvus alkylphenolicus]NIB40864.1 methyl-accepting chemotaxis protein [Pseudomaricurvus alkylphenolicus]
MRNNGPVTQQERSYDSHQRIVSTTTTAGIITGVNDHFIDISGYSEEELLGQPHNLVRHPDMPSAAFEGLWNTVKADRPWMGLVKNRCKNGDHYWVNAFVTPMVSNGQTIGYQSVRCKPKPTVVQRATNCYHDLLKGATYQPLLQRCMGGLTRQLLLLGVLALGLGIGIGLAVANEAMDITAVSAVLALAVILGAGRVIARPWISAAASAKKIFEDPVAQHIYTGRSDELGQLQLAIEFLKAQQQTIIHRSSEAVDELGQVAAEAGEVTQATQGNMHALNGEVDLVVSAMTEMTATVQEVARNATEAASANQEAFTNVEQGREVVRHTKDIIGSLAERIEAASSVIQRLAQDTETIGAVVDVINSVAEQTNLLALNAAIEAARAGEQGRGFAVVADEVRSLAGKTQASTGEITQMINTLQEAARSAVSAMEESSAAVEQSVSHSEQAEASLDVITRNVNTITDMSAQIATAAEQQSAVSEEINRNIVNINDSASNTLDGCQRVNKSNGELIESIEKLNNMINQFGGSR